MVHRGTLVFDVALSGTVTLRPVLVLSFRAQLRVFMISLLWGAPPCDQPDCFSTRCGGYHPHCCQVRQSGHLQNRDLLAPKNGLIKTQSLRNLSAEAFQTGA